MDNKEIVYLILQDKYIKTVLNKEDYTEEDAIKNSSKLFPVDWPYVNIDDKIKYINKAITENKLLSKIYNPIDNIKK